MSTQIHDEPLAVMQVLQTATSDLPKQMKHVVKPHGRINRNFMLAALIAGSVSVLLLWSSFNLFQGQAQKQTPRQPLATAPVQDVPLAAESAMLVSGGQSLQTLAPPTANKVTNAPTGLPQFMAPGWVGPNEGVQAPFQRLQNKAESSESVSAASNAQSTFSIGFRASANPTIHQMSAASSGEPAGEKRKSRPALSRALLGRLKLAEGTRIPMELVEPAATGEEAFTRARILTNVLDVNGQVAIPQNAIAYIPFASSEIAGGRVSLSQSETGFVMVNGQKLALEGSVRGADGRPGLPGKVKTSGNKNPFRHVLGAVANTVTGVVGMQSPVPLYGAEAAVMGSMSGMGTGEADYALRSTREVVVNAKTKFTFVFGL